MFDRVLVVCTGNICRSPMGEVLFRARAGESVVVRSGGTGALIGHAVDETAAAVLQVHGLDASEHRARQLDRELLRWAQLVLVMENYHRDEVQAMDATVRGKTFLLGHWLGQKQIDDPYGEDVAAFETAFVEIEQAVASWVGRL